MSKSSPDLQSRILLTDTEAQIRKKIRGAVTDSITGITYDPAERRGAANLLTILAACTNEEPSEVATRYASKGHGDLKADVADAVADLLRGPREEFERLKGETAYLTTIAEAGAAKARERSEVTMRKVRQLVGLV